MKISNSPRSTVSQKESCQCITEGGYWAAACEEPRLEILKGQFRYFEHWAPFLVCLGWNRVVDTEMLNIGPLSGIWFILNRPCSQWLAMCIHKPVLKTPVNVCFQNCETQTGPEPETDLCINSRARIERKDYNYPPFRFRFRSGFRFNLQNAK